MIVVVEHFSIYVANDIATLLTVSGVTRVVPMASLPLSFFVSDLVYDKP